MRTGLLTFALITISCPLAFAQDYRAPKPGTDAGATASSTGTSGAAGASGQTAEAEFTLGSQSVGNVNELVKKVQEQNDKATKRILEIDAYVNPILGETANKLYGIRPEEFLFLMKQSLSKRAPAVFRKQRTADNQTPEGILDYFDKAYAAIQAREYWYGREESLVPQDAALYQMMKTDVLAAIAKRPDGDKIQGMLSERDMLLSRLNTNLPLFNYLQERREWWKTYPDYMKAVEQESQGIDSEINGTPGWGGGGGRGGRGR
jgi:hypothetical protein